MRQFLGRVMLATALYLTPPSFAHAAKPAAPDPIENTVEGQKRLTFDFGVHFHYFQVHADGVLPRLVKKLPFEINDDAFYRDLEIDDINVLVLGAFAGFSYHHSVFRHSLRFQVAGTIPGMSVGKDEDGTVKDLSLPLFDSLDSIDYHVTADVTRMVTLGGSYDFQSLVYGRRDKFAIDLVGRVEFTYGFFEAHADFNATPTDEAQRERLENLVQTDQLTGGLDISGELFQGGFYAGVTFWFNDFFTTLYGGLVINYVEIDATGRVNLGQLLRETTTEQITKTTVGPAALLQTGFSY